MKKTKLFALGLSALLTLSALTGCGQANKTESDLQYVKDKGSITIGYTVYEPMNYTDPAGEFTGFDTEFAKAVCEKLGVKPDFKEINWDTKIIALDSKEIDCIWNGMTITDELKDNIAVSEPYVKNMQVLVIRVADKDKYKDTASLSGAKLTAEAGSAGQAVVEGDENLSKAPFVSVTKQTDALIELKSGASDAAVLDWTLASHMVGEGTDFADLMIVPDVELAVEEYGVGFRKGSDLVDQVNTIMNEMKQDGSLEALATRYGLNVAK